MNRRSILSFLTGAAASVGAKESVKVPTPDPPPVHIPPVRHIWPGTAVTMACTPEMRFLSASQVRKQMGLDSSIPEDDTWLTLSKSKGDINE